MSTTTISSSLPLPRFPLSPSRPTRFPSIPSPRKPYPSLRIRAALDEAAPPPMITVDNESDGVAGPDASEATAFVIRARNRIGLLQVITRVFKVLGLRIEKASVDFEGDGYFVKRFLVVDSRGRKIEDPESLSKIEKALREAILATGADSSSTVAVAKTRGFVVRRSGFPGAGDRSAKAERMFRLMDGFLPNDPISLQKDILDHVEYTVARSRFDFDDFEAYQGLSHSVRDRLIERWHDTHQYFKRKDLKRLYFLSLEFLMGIIM